VSFYQGDPSTGNAVLLPPVFTVADSVLQKQASFSALIKGITSGTIYAVVNDNGTAVPVNLPNTGLLEKLYTNNVIPFEYKPEQVVLQTSDTTVLCKATVPLTVASTLADPGSVI
jgi:hypothetical protein